MPSNTQRTGCFLAPRSFYLRWGHRRRDQTAKRVVLDLWPKTKAPSPAPVRQAR